MRPQLTPQIVPRPQFHRVEVQWVDAFNPGFPYPVRHVVHIDGPEVASYQNGRLVRDTQRFGKESATSNAIVDALKSSSILTDGLAPPPLLSLRPGKARFSVHYKTTPDPSSGRIEHDSRTVEMPESSVSGEFERALNAAKNIENSLWRTLPRFFYYSDEDYHN